MKSDINTLITLILNFMFSIFELVGGFLLKIPNNINLDDIRKKLLKVDGITDIHHVHVWSIDGKTLHVKANKGNAHKVKKDVKDLLAENNIIHTTVEIACNNCSNKKYHY